MKNGGVSEAGRIAATEKLYRTRPGLILGFHGCDLSVALELASGREQFRPSTNDYDWLGHGMYFWENNYQRALAFAKEKQQRDPNRYPNPTAIGAVLNLGNCLDLFDQNSRATLNDGFRQLSLMRELMQKPLPENQKVKGQSEFLLRYLDCAVVNTIHEALIEDGDIPFDSVRGGFPEGEEVYPGSAFHMKDHIQISVRNPNCIKGFFWPRMANPYWPVP
jgi:hypothetical protein